MIKSVLKFVFFIVFIFQFVAINVAGQNLIPNLSSNTQAVIEKDLSALLHQSLSYYSQQQWVKCDSSAHELIHKATILESRYYQGRGYLILGKVYAQKNEDIKAYFNLLMSSKLFFLINEYQYLAESELEKGILYNHQKLWDKAYTSLSLADSLYQSIHFTFDLVKLYGNLGKASAKLENYNDALLFLGLYRRYSVVYQQWDDQRSAIITLSETYRKMNDYKSAIQYDMELIKTYRQTKSPEYFHAIKVLGDDNYKTGNYSLAENNYKIVLENSKSSQDVLSAYLKLSSISLKNRNDAEAIVYLNKAWGIAHDNNSKVEIINQLTKIYIEQSDYQKAKEYNTMSISLLDNVLLENIFKTYDLAQMIAVAKKDYKEALKYTQLSAQISDSLMALSFENRAKLAALNSRINRFETSKQFEFIKDNMEQLNEEKRKLKEEKISQELAMLKLEKNNKKIEEENLRLRLKQAKKDAILYQQKLDNQEKMIQIRNMQRRDTISRLVIAGDSIRQLQHKQELSQIASQKKVIELEAERAKRRNIYLLIILALVVLSLIIYVRHMRTIKQSNHLLAEKNLAINAERKKLTEMVAKLEAAKTQLIESERLASLGQLTAGIAHEIRNPLNFVNNFAKLSKEYADEIGVLIDENVDKYSPETHDELKELTEYLRENSSKIMEHGNRAARIIARMLETARSDNAVKEFTDLNLLLEDSVNLAYQGIRGENPDFLAQLNFDFDSQIKQVKMVTQDMGRVFINLINNACQAMISKQESNKDYEPILSVSTKKKDSRVIIEIQDNGIGMPEKVQREIFNPFFTTKAPGKGTGLGLTMSFDIVKKIHGGEIKFVSEENEFTKFIIELPIS